MTGPETLFRSSPMAVRPEWIDINGHLNVAYYHVLFDRAVDEFLVELGMNAEFIRTRRLTTFIAEAHSRYVREVPPESEVFSTAQIVDHDEKRIHVFQELRHKEGWLAATLESLVLSIDMSGPKVTSFAPEVTERIRKTAERHAALPRPEGVGSSVGIRRKS